MTDFCPDFGIYSSRILTETGFIEGTILIKNGTISKVIQGKALEYGCPIEDIQDLVVMPGVIDSHVHINEPGRTEWEGFETITKAAIAGGITTLVDMPLNASPVTTSKHAFEVKMKSTEGKLYCNCGFWGGIVPDNIHLLDELIEAGVIGIKAFLTHSGIEDFPNVNLPDLKKGLAILKKYQIPLLVHAELDEMHEGITAFENDPTNYQAYLKSRPNIWEDSAVEMAIQLCEEFDTPVHIVHLSSANGLDKIRAAKKKELKLTVETCPQYLYFCSEEIPNANTLFKCAPPIREKANNHKLWEAIKDGTIDFIVTDHSPSTPNLKEIESGNLKRAWGGISSIQFSLPIIWTAGQKRGFNISQISSLMSENAFIPITPASINSSNK
jgi:allantoinase